MRFIFAKYLVSLPIESDILARFPVLPDAFLDTNNELRQ